VGGGMMDFLTKEMIYQKSSQDITTLLYEVFLDTIESAITDVETRNYIDANIKMKKLNDILERLGVGINYEAGIIADQLDALYNYMAGAVINANIQKDVSLLKEVQEIAQELSSAWRITLKNKPVQSGNRLSRRASAYEKNVLVYEQDANSLEAGK
jgi:flagellar secretion chaperone FliS